VVNDLTLGEYSVLTTVIPIREQYEDTIFEQMLTMRERLGIQIPDAAILANSKLPNKQELIDGMAEGEVPRQKLEELEIAEKQAKIDKINTESIKIRAEAVEKIGRAKQAEEEGQQGGLTPELILQKQEIDGKLALEQRKIDGELKLKQEEIRRKYAIDAAGLKLKEREVDVKEKQANKAPSQTSGASK
jgi:hypothetical protein